MLGWRRGRTGGRSTVGNRGGEGLGLATQALWLRFVAVHCWDEFELASTDGFRPQLDNHRWVEDACSRVTVDCAVLC